MRPRPTTKPFLIPVATALALVCSAVAPAAALAVAGTAPQNPVGFRAFSPDSFWYTRLPEDARLAGNSAQIVQAMHADAQKPEAFGAEGRPHIAINTHSYSPTRYVVDDSTPTQRVYFNNTYNKPANDIFVYEIFNALDAPMRSVRIPEDAVPANGTDREIIVYDRGDVNDPSDDVLYEMWQLSRREDGAWQAVWGSAIENPGQQQGQFMWPTGVTAAGLPLEGGIIQYEELRAGRIDHVLGIAVPWATPDSWQFPANRTDGRAHPDGLPTVRQGQMLRIDPGLDVASLNLHPSAEAIVRAGQEYGYVVWDTSPAFSFRAENPLGDPRIDYSDLFPNGEAYRLMDEFPWEHLQVLDQDYSALADVRSRQEPLLPAGQDTVTLEGVYSHYSGGALMQTLLKPSKYNYHRSSDETYTLHDESLRDRFNEIWGDGVVSAAEVLEIQQWVEAGGLSVEIANTQHYAAVDVLAEMENVDRFDAGQAEGAVESATLTLGTEGDAAPAGVTTVVVPELWSHFNGGPLQLSLTRPDYRYYHSRSEVIYEIRDESIRADFNDVWADRNLSPSELTQIRQWIGDGSLTQSTSNVRYFQGALKELAAKRAEVERRAGELAAARAAAKESGVAAGGVEGTVSTVTLLTEGDVAPYGVDTVVMPRTWSHFIGGPLQYDLIRPSKSYYHSLSKVRYQILDGSIREQFNGIWADRRLTAKELSLIKQWIRDGKLTMQESKIGYHHPGR